MKIKKDKLKNGGIRTETTILNKTFVAGSIKMPSKYSHESYRLYPLSISVEVKKVDLATEAIYIYEKGEPKLSKVGNSKKSNNLIDLREYYRLSISGSYQYGGGQCQDLLLNKDFTPKKSFNSKIFKAIWDTWHLNDVTSGTQIQEEALLKWKARPEGWSYSEDLEYLQSKNLSPDRGYEFGSSWLVKELPLEVIEDLKNIIGKLK